MVIKIKACITGFGERFCSNYVEYKITSNGTLYRFYKKGTVILHNEYGPAVENECGSYVYFINGRLHRLEGYAYSLYKKYFIIGKYLGETKEDFVKNLANVLIPINNNYL